MADTSGVWRLYSLFIIEGGLIALAIGLALIAPRLCDPVFHRATALFDGLARRPVASLAAIGLAPIVLHALLTPATMHAPWVHDEYAYLLAADTFAHGRLTNPPHPLWEFFESMHILQQPTYASKYPPAQGMVLGLAQALTGRPWIGVQVTVGLMCAALLWMLRAWFPPGWAFLGASLAMLRLGIFSYWMNSYWGGALAAMAGALAAGAVGRLWKHPRMWHGAFLGVGLVILANTRPFEGACFSLPLVAAVLWKRAWRPLLPMAAVLALGFAGMGYYNWRVTGNPWLMPEALHYRQYNQYPFFFFQHQLPEQHYRHAVLRDYYVGAEAMRGNYVPHGVGSFIGIFADRLQPLRRFFLGPLLILALAAGIGGLASRKLAVLWAAFLAATVGVALESLYLMPHYYAPALCAMFALVVQAMRHLRHWTWLGRPAGLFLVRAIPVICVLMVATRALAAPLGIQVYGWPPSWYNSIGGNDERARIEATLRARPEKYVVVVRYAPQHNPEWEWVYNEADIDHARVVWAREMKSGNQRLLDYFHDRKFVLVEPDIDPLHFRPYAPPADKVEGQSPEATPNR